jgi:hypothetical protein
VAHLWKSRHGFVIPLSQIDLVDWGGYLNCRVPADHGFSKYRWKTREEQFPQEMETIIPRMERCEAIEPLYPKPSGAGRRTIGIEQMCEFMCPEVPRHWFNLSDPAAEKALYNSRALGQSLVLILAGRELGTRRLKISLRIQSAFTLPPPGQCNFAKFKLC